MNRNRPDLLTTGAPAAPVAAATRHVAAADAPPAAEPHDPPVTRNDRPDPKIRIEIVPGPITAVKAPVAVVGQYLGTAPAGGSKEFDQRMNCWLTRAHELGMIGARLGELFYVPLEGFKARRRRGVCPPRRAGDDSPALGEAGGPSPAAEGADLAADGLILAGLGEPGRFGGDDLSYLMTNVTLAVHALGHDEFATMLLGSHRREISTDRSVRALIEGVADGLRRTPAGFGWSAVTVFLVARSEQQRSELATAFRELQRRGDPVPGVELEVVVRDRPAPPEGDSRRCDPPPPDLPPPERTTRITIVRPADAGADAAAVTLEYAAMAETAVVPVRRARVQRYFADRLPVRLPSCETADEQERYGRLLANYLIPEEFRRLVEDGDSLTMILDKATATYPWEMAAFRCYGRICFLGTDLKLTRQFRTQLSPAPGLAPPLNHTLKVLVIADPAPGEYGLRGARAEGLAVLRVLDDLDAAWGGELDIRVDVRIGPPEDWPGGQPPPEVAAEAARAGRRQKEVDFASFGPCDPVELLLLLVSERYDVVHYAGHGVFEPEGHRKGWLLRGDCVLSASEIFQARHVPRLVFANACHSGKVGDGTPSPDVTLADPREAQVGLAEAFFARGVENYLGTGWEVDDALARRFAERFYAAALGLGRPSGTGDPAKAAPVTLGDALAEARREVFDLGGTTWAAYQHYGRSNAKLLAVPNDELGEVAG